MYLGRSQHHILDIRDRAEFQESASGTFDRTSGKAVAMALWETQEDERASF
jgi:hypothetical protein